MGTQAKLKPFLGKGQSNIVQELPCDQAEYNAEIENHTDTKVKYKNWERFLYQIFNFWPCVWVFSLQQLLRKCKSRTNQVYKSINSLNDQ